MSQFMDRMVRSLTPMEIPADKPLTWKTIHHPSLSDGYHLFYRGKCTISPGICHILIHLKNGKLNNKEERPGIIVLVDSKVYKQYFCYYYENDELYGVVEILPLIDGSRKDFDHRFAYSLTTMPWTPEHSRGHEIAECEGFMNKYDAIGHGNAFFHRKEKDRQLVDETRSAFLSLKPSNRDTYEEYQFRRFPVFEPNTPFIL